MKVLLTKSYLCGSVPVHDALPKLSAGRRGERSQCRPAMADSEEAGQLHSEGWRVGLSCVRASVPRAKHEIRSPQSLAWQLIRLPVTTAWVPGVVTWRKWQLIHTGEFPPRSEPPVRITLVHKARPKRPVHAGARRRFSQSPPSWGIQQSRSSGTRAVKDNTDPSSEATASLMETVSRPAQATKWPGRASFAQPGRSLSNISQYSGRGLPTVRRR
jgi:hypothetical protein